MTDCYPWTKEAAELWTRDLEKLERAKTAIEFAYDWALNNTPNIRPYDLTDQMREALDKIKEESN